MVDQWLTNGSSMVDQWLTNGSSMVDQWFIMLAGYLGIKSRFLIFF